MFRSSIAVLFILVVAVIAFVALAPASWVDRRLAKATDGKVRISDAQGTVWRGRGALTDAQGAWRIPVAWRVAPLALVRGELEIEFEPSGDLNGVRGAVALANTTVALQAFNARVPASAIRSFVPLALPLQAGGTWVVEASSFRYGGGATDGTLNVRWDGARVVVGASTVDLGNVATRLAPQGGQLAGTIENTAGDVQIRGEIGIGASGSMVRADIVPIATLSPDIAQAIAMLGTRGPDGAVHVQWRSGPR